MRTFFTILTLSQLGLVGCASTSDRQAQNAATRSEVAAEIHRICTLPEDQRHEETERVKRESGMAIVCPNH